MNKTNDLMSTPRKKKLVPPTTPKSKTILKSGVWGHVVGLKRLDEAVYYRYPIDKSYCSFGRNDSNDIRVQIDGVSEMHCKLIRRDDGEVWLKDTSTNGTLLNNVLVHDTARPIQHLDVITVGGRKFRFEISETASRPPLQSAANGNTPGRHVRDIQATIDKDIQTLAEVPSPTPDRLLTTPKKNLARSTAALESSLGLFTPNRAAKLSSLLVSPKPVPLPAFLTKSPRKPSTPKPVLTMIDEPSLFNPTAIAAHSEEESFSVNTPGLQTPTREKRKAPEDFDGVTRTPKKVSFGPALSPEIFDKSNPPSTPIKRGQQQDPETPRRQGTSTPSLLSRLSAIGSASKPILTPSRLSRTSNLIDLERPAPPNLFAPENQKNVEETMRTDKSEDAVSSNQGGNSSEEVLRRQEMRAPAEDDADTKALNALAGILASPSEDGEQSPHHYDSDDDMYDDDQSPPTTPTRGPKGRISAPLMPTPSRQMQSSSSIFQQERNQLVVKRNSSPLGSDDEELLMKPAQERDSSNTSSPTTVQQNSLYSDDVNPFDEESIAAAEIRLEFSSPARAASEDMDTTPVHTPVRRRALRDINEQGSSPFPSTPGSASRQALLQLSAQKMKGLPDLLQSPSVSVSSSESANSVSSTPTATKVRLSIAGLFDVDDTDQIKEQEDTIRKTDERQDTAPVDQEQDEEEEKNNNNDANEVEHQDDGAFVQEESSAVSPDLSSSESRLQFSAETDRGRRSSAPANTIRHRSSSPFLTGLRGVFRTPQKMVSTCFSGFAGIRDYVMSPSKPSSRQLSSATADVITDEHLEESAVESLEVAAVTAAAVDNTDPGEKKVDDVATRLASGSSSIALSPAQPLEQVRARNRRSDTFPQMRTIAGQSRRQTHGGESHPEPVEKEARRRTFSLFEFRRDYSSGATAATSAPDSDIAVSISAVEYDQEPVTNQPEQQQIDGGEDAEQAELLRLLGEGADPADDDEDAMYLEDNNGEGDLTMDHTAMEGGGAAQEEEDGDDDRIAVYSRRTSSSSYESRAGTNTPIKRRTSFKQRLGSSSPAFRLYEQQDEDEDEEREDEDIVRMISPKRVRTNFLQ
ncbi:antigen identified by monoclonal antibody Ki-67 [Mortierella sp. GBA30]|nr:antigen identified by monoclonal antibody Ki-67 [Mortierella sp. GBA30]